MNNYCHYCAFCLTVYPVDVLVCKGCNDYKGINPGRICPSCGLPASTDKVKCPLCGTRLAGPRRKVGEKR